MYAENIFIFVRLYLVGNVFFIDTRYKSFIWAFYIGHSSNKVIQIFNNKSKINVMADNF